MKLRISAVLLVTGLVFLGAACGGGGAEADSGSASSGSSEAGLSDTIVLPEGWEMLDAVSVADVEAVVGATGYEPWAESLSDAAAGKPQGGYATADGAPSKINFLVYTTDGQAEYDRVAGFIEDSTPVSGDLWDQAIIGTLYDGDKLKALLLRRGDVCMRIAWNPAAYADWDQTELGTKLATMLVDKLYTK